MDVVGAVTTVSAIPALHSVGAGLASAVMNLAILCGFSVLSWNLWETAEDGSNEADKECLPFDEYPLPDYLCSYTGAINVCVVGATGSGKSSLVNVLSSMQGVEAQRGAPAAQEVTRAPVPYCFPNAGCLQEGESPKHSSPWPGLTWCSSSISSYIWDMPGINTASLPVKTCTRDVGFAHFDAVIVVYTGRITDVERRLVAELDEWAKVPHVLVRTQIDVDLENEAADYGRSEEDVLPAMRQEAVDEGFSAVFLVSSHEPLKFDMFPLCEAVSALVKARRRSFNDIDCPICFNGFESEGPLSRCSCHWCGNAVCGTCATKVRGKHREAPCPFCRRWTALAKPPIY